jgi:hypothetical protein
MRLVIENIDREFHSPLLSGLTKPRNLEVKDSRYLCFIAQRVERPDFSLPAQFGVPAAEER